LKVVQCHGKLQELVDKKYGEILDSLTFSNIFYSVLEAERGAAAAA
jgi:hypothetical protein